MDKIKAFSTWFISGAWFVSIMRQVVVTGGNIAESAFLLATLWVIVNAVAHTLITWIIDNHTIELFNYLSVVAFSALPELIIIPVIVICYTHWAMAINRKDRVAMTWAVLYTVPALFFLVLTIIAITRFVSTGGNTFAPIDGVELVIRCLSGWMYAVVNMLCKKLGEPHYESKLSGKDSEIKALESRIEEIELGYQSRINQMEVEHQSRIEMLATEHQSRIEAMATDYRNEVNDLALQLKAASSEINQLSERASSLDRDIVALYPKIQLLWIQKGVKSVTLEQIEEVTTLKYQRISAAARTGKLKNAPRSKDKFLVSSVIDWLRSLPVIESSNGHSIDESNPLELPVISILE